MAKKKYTKFEAAFKFEELETKLSGFTAISCGSYLHLL
jgi:hypothetical protein